MKKNVTSDPVPVSNKHSIILGYKELAKCHYPFCNDSYSPILHRIEHLDLQKGRGFHWCAWSSAFFFHQTIWTGIVKGIRKISREVVPLQNGFMTLLCKS